MSCLECVNFRIISKDGEPVETCKIRGELREPFLDRLATCCGNSPSSFDSTFFIELEKISENCEYFKKEGEGCAVCKDHSLLYSSSPKPHTLYSDKKSKRRR